MNVNAKTLVIYSPSQGLHHHVRAVNKPSEHVQELCVSHDVNKQHVAEGGVPDLFQSPRGLLRNFYFSGKMTKNLSSFFYQTISMNHHITKTAEEVLRDFLTGIAPLNRST